MTKYDVFRKNDETEEWRFVSSADAASSEGAIRSVLSNGAAQSGTFVATPSRSWKPVTVAAEASVKLAFGPTQTMS